MSSSAMTFDPSRCSRCDTPYREERAYCLSCGHVGWFFRVPQEMSGESCYAHPSHPAVRYCTLCSRPICEACKKREGTSMVVFLPTTQCVECASETNRLDAAHQQAMHAAGRCPEHPSAIDTHICVGCGFKFCAKCLSFSTRGFFFLRPDRGPFCLMCFVKAFPPGAARRPGFQMPATHRRAIRHMARAGATPRSGW